MRIAQKIDEDGSEYFDLTQSLKAVVPVSTFINDNLLFEIKSEIKKNVLNYFINSVFNLEINDAECIFTGIKYKERYANNALGIFSSAENMEKILLKGAFNFNPYNFDKINFYLVTKIHKNIDKIYYYKNRGYDSQILSCIINNDDIFNVIEEYNYYQLNDEIKAYYVAGWKNGQIYRV